LIYHLQAKQGTHASLELAEQGYELAIQFDASNWLAQYYAGQLAIEMSKFDKARMHLAEALLFRADDADALNAFAYAAYRSGHSDLAAGSIDALARLGKVNSEQELKNAAMIMAAVGKDEQAKKYLARLKESTRDSRVDLVQRRLDDWAGFHKHQGSLVKTSGAADLSQGVMPALAERFSKEGLIKSQYGSQYGGGQPQGGGGGSLPAPGPSAPGTENNMVVVDVVMIATEETFTSSRGINLLNGLKSTYKLDRVNSISDTASVPVTSTTFTRTLGIATITYNLNIANSNVARNEILARPTLVASAGKASEFFYGVELSAAVTGGSATNTPISIQKEIGVKLSVTPAFLDRERVSMAVSAQRSFIKSPNSDTKFDYKLETSKSQVTANVVMRFGESLILGGLSDKEAGNTRDGVPLLQDIPILQYLFSTSGTTDIQKSVLIIITPRPAQFIYQSEKARAEHEKDLPEEERPIASLRARYADWFKPYPNWASIFHHMQENSLYREFRTGDVALESWADLRTLKDRLKIVSDFIYY
jgi:hypothetical protein